MKQKVAAHKLEDEEEPSCRTSDMLYWSHFFKELDRRLNKKGLLGVTSYITMSVAQCATRPELKEFFEKEVSHFVTRMRKA